MSKKEKVWFNWHCPHCQHRNRVWMPMQFEIPGYYSAIWECKNCSKESKLEWNLTVNGWWKKKKTPKIKKVLKEEKKRKKEEKDDVEVQKDKEYKNNKVKQKV